jgi:hypothetical protein
MINNLNRNLVGAALSLRDSVKQTAVAGTIVSLILCASFSASLLVGQSTTTGGIAGVVEDPSSAVVTGATVTLHNLDNGNTQTATTGDTGAYQFPLLTPGNYTVQATFTGLKSDVTKSQRAGGRRGQH